MSVLTETKDEILYLDFNSPPVNVLRSTMIRDIISVFDAEKAAKVIALKGSGKLFCAGLDVEEHLPGKVEEMISLFSDLILRLFTFPGVVASVVHGGAYGGGCEIALCSDLLIAEKNVEFSQPEIKLGVFPPAACALFPLLMPSKVANFLIYSGEGLKSDALEEMGIVNKTFEGESLFEMAHEYLLRFPKKSGPALRWAKKSANVALPEIRKRLAEVNRIYLEELMRAEDPVEGLRAFLEKRKPVWKNQ